MKNSKTGISLIVLIITIIVSLILLSVIILNLDKNNPIGSAKEVKFKTDIENFIDEISITYTNKKAENIKYKFSDMNIKIGSKDKDTGEYIIKEYIPSITDEYVDRLGIQEGTLIYKESDFTEDEVGWLQEEGAKVYTNTEDGE